MKTIKKFMKNNSRYVLIGGLIIVLYFILRLSALTVLPVFADEAIYIRWAQVMRAEPTLRFLPLSDGKQPLYMWSVIPFLKVFSDPLFAGRALSVVTGFGTMVGVFILSLLLFRSKTAAFVAALLYCVSPFSVFFDRMALADSMLAMFGVFTLVGGVMTAKTLRLDFAMLTGFSLGGALLTKSPAMFFAILLPLSFLFAEWKRPLGNVFKTLSKLTFLFIPTYLIAWGMYNILRLGPNFSMVASRNKDYVYPLSHVFTSFKDPLFSFVNWAFEWMGVMGPWSVVILAFVGGVFILGRYPRQILVLAVWFLGPILVQAEFAKNFTARYILFSIPYLFVLASGFILMTNRDLLKKVMITLMVLGVLWALKFDSLLIRDVESAPLPRSERSGYLEEWTAGHGIRETADYLRQEQQKSPQSTIVVGTEGFFGTLPDGLQMYLNDDREIIVIGVGLNFDELHSSLVESKKFGNRTFFVVNSTRFSSNPEKLGLDLVGVFSKALRPQGTLEYNLRGPQESLLLFEVNDDAIKTTTKR